MPELPEVQTVVNGIKSKVINRKILQFKKYTHKLRYPINRNVAQLVENNRAINVRRRAKYIIIELSNNTSLVMHLGMSGRVIITQNGFRKKIKHTHICIFFDKNIVLQFIDPRKFGYIFVTATNLLKDHKYFRHLGVEPLKKEFSPQYFYNLLATKKSPIKNIIMNQKYIVGVGNIYASEALFIAAISPMKLGNKFTLLESDKLTKAIKTVLKKSIKMGGSSINDHTMISGKMGYFQNKLNVYDREGLKCRKRTCQSNIIRIVIAKRSTFFCKECQK